jgi:hypothetical protein
MQSVPPEDRAGFWLVSQAARVLTQYLAAEQRGQVRCDDAVIPLWQNSVENDGNDCRASFVRSERAIYVSWGRC